MVYKYETVLTSCYSPCDAQVMFFSFLGIFQFSGSTSRSSSPQAFT